jgi:hypothetical protein
LQLAYVEQGQSIVGSHKPREAKLNRRRLLVAVDGTTRDCCWPLVDLSGRYDGSLLVVIVSCQASRLINNHQDCGEAGWLAGWWLVFEFHFGLDE